MAVLPKLAMAGLANGRISHPYGGLATRSPLFRVWLEPGVRDECPAGKIGFDRWWRIPFLTPLQGGAHQELRQAPVWRLGDTCSLRKLAMAGITILVSNCEFLGLI